MPITIDSSSSDKARLRTGFSSPLVAPPPQTVGSNRRHARPLQKLVIVSGKSSGAELDRYRSVKALRQAAAHAEEPPDLECWVLHANTCQVQRPITGNRVCLTVLVLAIAECPRGPQPRIKLGGSIPCLRQSTRDIQDRGLDPRACDLRLEASRVRGVGGVGGGNHAKGLFPYQKPNVCVCVSFRAGPGLTKGLELRPVQHALKGRVPETPDFVTTF